MKYIIYFLKGAFIGGTMLIPGVSGGTMAMALGMYQKLIESVASVRKKFKESLSVLLPFALGGLLGAILLSSPIELLLGKFRLPVMYFFVGSIAGSVPMIMKKAFSMSDSKKLSLRDILCIAAGAAVPVFLNLLPKIISGGALNLGSEDGIVGAAVSLLVGGICALSLSLPGISTSFILLLLGVYDKVLDAFAKIDAPYLLPMALGALIGIILFSKFMEKQLTKRPRASYTIILGFMLGSIATVFPYVMPSGFEWLFCPLLFAAAFILMFMLSKFEK